MNPVHFLAVANIGTGFFIGEAVPVDEDVIEVGAKVLELEVFNTRLAFQ